MPGEAAAAAQRATQATRVARAFALRGDGCVWIVESGKLDVFLAPLDAGSPTGALTHVFRVEAGGALFPMPFDPVSHFGFLAAPAAETTVQVCPLEDLSALERNRLAIPWMRGIAQSLDPAPPSLPLVEFHDWAAAGLIERRVQAEQEEAERLNARLRADEKLVGVALRKLARPLSQAGPAEGAAEGTPDAPLVAACLAAAKAAGIELKIPHSVIQQKAKDPLRAIARSSAIRMRKLILRDGWWKQDSGPMVAFLDNGNKPVALLPRAGRGYDLFNPEQDTRVRVNRGAARTLNGVAYVFYRPFPHRALSGAEVLREGLKDAAAICGSSH